jgi:hypothetical protein
MWQRTFEIENILDFFFKFAHYSQGGDHPISQFNQLLQSTKYEKKNFQHISSYSLEPSVQIFFKLC